MVTAVFSDKLYQIVLPLSKSNNHFIRKFLWASFIKNVLTSRYKTNFMPLKAQEWGMTTPPVCLAYVINLICIHWVNCGYGTLFITLGSDILLSLGLNRFISARDSFISSMIQISLWQNIILKIFWLTDFSYNLRAWHYRCYPSRFEWKNTLWYTVDLRWISLPFLPLQPQDQILRLAAPFRDLECFTGTPQWMGHGHQ